VRLGVAYLLVVDLVERVETFDGAFAQAVRHAWRVIDEEDGIARAAEGNTGVLTWQVATGPESGGDGLFLLPVRGGGDEDDEVRQVLVYRSKPVGSPGTKAGTAGDLVPGLHRGDGGFMIDGLGVQAAHPADVIGILRQIRQKLRVHHHAALTCRAEVELRRRDGEARLAACHRGQALTIANARRQVFVIVFLHLRLVVEEVHLRWPTDHVQINDPLGLGRKMGHRVRTGACTSKAFAEQGCQSCSTEEVGAVGKKLATGEGVHGVVVS